MLSGRKRSPWWVPKRELSKGTAETVKATNESIKKSVLNALYAMLPRIKPFEPWLADKPRSQLETFLSRQGAEAMPRIVCGQTTWESAFVIGKESHPL